jgi:demethoxyubiquinone hydroxylase (CLK1/Coq7/Cat5 family)
MMEYDSSVIRPQMTAADIQFRGKDLPQERLRGIKKGLLTLHTLELMAVNIYRFQIARKTSELNRQLISAMCNEMTHLQDFQVKLFEYGWKPSRIRWMYWIVGFTFGFISRIFGRKAILRTGIWVERKAVSHYSELLETIDWDGDTRRVIEKDQSDEYGHISRWEKLLQTGE